MLEVVNLVRKNFTKAWKLQKFLIVDEMMIPYKGIDYPTCHYMPKIFQK